MWFIVWWTIWQDKNTSFSLECSGSERGRTGSTGQSVSGCNKWKPGWYRTFYACIHRPPPPHPHTRLQNDIQLKTQMDLRSTAVSTLQRNDHQLASSLSWQILFTGHCRFASLLYIGCSTVIALGSKGYNFMRVIARVRNFNFFCLPLDCSTEARFATLYTV